MPTVKIEVIAGADTMTLLNTVSGPDMIRFVAAVRVNYNINPGWTDVQAIEFWAQDVVKKAKEMTRLVEQAVASRTVSEIGFT